MKKDIYSKRNDWAGFLLMATFLVTGATWYLKVYRPYVSNIEKIRKNYEKEIELIKQEQLFLNDLKK